MLTFQCFSAAGAGGWSPGEVFSGRLAHNRHPWSTRVPLPRSVLTSLSSQNHQNQKGNATGILPRAEIPKATRGPDLLVFKHRNHRARPPPPAPHSPSGCSPCSAAAAPPGTPGPVETSGAQRHGRSRSTAWRALRGPHGPAVRLGWAEPGTARLGRVRLGSAQLSWAQLGTAWLGWARHGSAQHGSAELGTAQHSSAVLNSARLGSARFRAALLGWARGGGS